MTTGTVTFYKMKGSLSSGEYPLLTTGQNLSSFQVHSATVKYAKGLQTRIVMPTFTNWETANIAYLDNQFYWVTASKESTTYNGSIEFTLDYMGPTSFFRSGVSVKGVWKRTPTKVISYLQDQITNGIMGSSRTVDFSTMDCPKSKSYLDTYWIQVSGHDNQGNIKQYGGFIGYDSTEEDFDWLNSIYAPSGDYLPYGKWMNDLHTYTGLTIDDVDDISISKRCPYQVIKQQIPDSTLYRLSLKSNATPGYKEPDLVGSYYLYDLTSLKLSGAMLVIPKNTSTITITLSDNERLLSHISLKDWNKNDLMVIDAGRSSSITITATMHADISGIYCVVKVFDDQISIPEGKLPYFGNSASTYKAYSMDSDRMAMQYAIQTAHYNRETSDMVTAGNTVSSALQGLAIGGMTGNPVTAVSGVMSGIASGITNAYQNTRAMDLSLIQAKQDYELSKKRAIDQPTSGYNVSYGSVYAYLNELSPMVIDIRMPVNLTTTDISAWGDNYGYPCEGEHDVSVAKGYYQGKLLSDGDAKSGMYWDECNKTFMQGFKFINPS